MMTEAEKKLKLKLKLKAKEKAIKEKAKEKAIKEKAKAKAIKEKAKAKAIKEKAKAKKILGYVKGGDGIDDEIPMQDALKSHFAAYRNSNPNDVSVYEDALKQAKEKHTHQYIIDGLKLMVMKNEDIDSLQGVKLDEVHNYVINHRIMWEGSAKNILRHCYDKFTDKNNNKVKYTLKDKVPTYSEFSTKAIYL